MKDQDVARTDPRRFPGRLLLDSADLEDVRRAAELGYVHGVTTNPKLLSLAEQPPLDHISAILEALPSGTVYHQLQAEDERRAWTEASSAHELAPSRVVLKLHATPWHFQFASKLVAQGIAVAMTAVYSAAQYLLATEIGAEGVIPYVDRSARLEPDQPPVVRRLGAVRDRLVDGPLIIAASIKSAQQASDAVVNGADMVSAPLRVLVELGEHPLANSALEDFRAYL